LHSTKCVKQRYTPSSKDVLELLDTFRLMINEAIRVGVEKNITSRFKLSNETYFKFRNNNLHTWYRLSAIEKASSILKNYRKSRRKSAKVKRPYVRKSFASLGNQAFQINREGKLRIPIEPKHFVEIPLNRHTLEVLSAPNLKLGSITITLSSISISFSKEIEEIIPKGYIGIDRNLDNATTASSDGRFVKFDTSNITKMKEKFSEVKSHFNRNDSRVRKQVFAKYGRKQSEIENHELHNIAKKIAKEAKKLSFGLVMENIKGIRRLYKRGNKQSRKFRRKLNSWSFYKLQKMIEYKAKWEGIPVIHVPPHRTSSTCAICGSKVVEFAERKIWCPKCKTLVDRDLNAARNILARGLRFKPIGLPREVMKRNPQIMAAILRADGSQLTSATEDRLSTTKEDAPT
jgi:putative transposase